MGQQENTARQHELENLMEPPRYEEGSSDQPAPGPGPSRDQKQKVSVKFMICTKLWLTEYKAEFWMDPSTTLQEACDIANQRFGRDWSVPDGNAFRKVVRSVGEWMAIETSQNQCNVILVKPRVLAGDLHQTVGEANSEVTYLYLSNSIDCFHVEDRIQIMIPIVIILGLLLLVLLIFLVCKLISSKLS